jgi:hypothetical protein
MEHSEISLQSLSEEDMKMVIKKQLTKLVDRAGWIIYRDPEVGLYALNETLNEEINLMMWNLTLSEIKTANLNPIKTIQADIDKYIEENRQK